MRGAQPSSPSHVAHSTQTALGREFNPAEADCGLQGTANSPSSTATPNSEVDRALESPRPRFPRPSDAEAPRGRDQRMAERARFELAVRLPVHGISSAAPSAARSPLRTSQRRYLRKNWRRGEDLNPRGTHAPIRFRVGRLRPGSATPPRSRIKRLESISSLRTSRESPATPRSLEVPTAPSLVPAPATRARPIFSTAATRWSGEGVGTSEPCSRQPPRS